MEQRGSDGRLEEVINRIWMNVDVGWAVRPVVGEELGDEHKELGCGSSGWENLKKFNYKISRNRPF